MSRRCEEKNGTGQVRSSIKVCGITVICGMWDNSNLCLILSGLFLLWRRDMYCVGCCSKNLDRTVMLFVLFL